MALLLLSFVTLGFMLFFYGIGLRYLAFVPLIFLGIFFGYYGATQTIKIKGTEILQKYALYIAWIIILAGLVGVFNFFGMDLTTTALWLLGLNLLLRIASYIANYQDGKSIFQIGYYLAVVFLLIIWLALGGRLVFFNVFMMLRVLHLGIIAFFIFIIGQYAEIEQYLRYKLGVLTLWTIFFVVFDQIKNMYLALTINSAILTGIFYLVYRIFQYTPTSTDTKKDISVRRILAGERITAPKKVFTSKTVEALYNFLTAMPSRTKQVLELFNVILIAILIIYYMTHLATFATVNHLLYRVVIGTFVANVMFLKKVWYNSILQNLVVFLVINFAIYVSLFSYFNGDAGAVVGRWIIRNIYSASMIFYAHKVPMLAKIFSKTDYMYWIVASIWAMIVNVLLLMKTDLPGQLIFFLVLVYVWLQSMVLFYAARYLGRIQTLN